MTATKTLALPPLVLATAPHGMHAAAGEREWHQGMVDSAPLLVHCDLHACAYAACGLAFRADVC